MRYMLKDLEKEYELELGRVVSEIGKSGAKSVLLQLPDGLKPWGPVLCDYLEKRCWGAPKGVPPAQMASADADKVGKVSIWLGACFGACDLPDGDADLVIQFGHAAWD